MMLILLAVVFGAYIMLEAVQAMAAMPGGDRACRVARYVLAAQSGFALVWYACKSLVLQAPEIDWLHISLACSLALFVWPRMIARMWSLLGIDRRVDRRA